MNKMVSIIMPAHNAAVTIGDSIDSVIKQTYSDWELLIINDCSTDETLTIINKYAEKDKRIKIFKTDKSVGKPFYPRNVGITNANGRFIAFLDSDDIWLATKLEKQIPLFENEKVGIVFSNYEKFSSTQTESKKGRVVKSPAFISFNCCFTIIIPSSISIISHFIKVL